MSNKIKIECVEWVSKTSKHLNEYHSGEFFRLNYNLETGAVWVNFMKLSEKNHYCIYPDGNVLNCGDILEPVTEKEVMEMVERAVSAYEKKL